MIKKSSSFRYHYFIYLKDWRGSL